MITNTKYTHNLFSKIANEYGFELPTGIPNKNEQPYNKIIKNNI